MNQHEQFTEVYARQLIKSMGDRPDYYVYPKDEAPKVVERMRPTFLTGTFNLDGSPALKATCKELGIKFTIRDIVRFCNNDQS